MLKLKCDLNELKKLKNAAKPVEKTESGKIDFVCFGCDKTFKNYSYEFKNHFAGNHIFQTNKKCGFPAAKKGRRFPPGLMDLFESNDKKKHFCYFSENNENEYKNLQTRKKNRNTFFKNVYKSIYILVCTLNFSVDGSSFFLSLTETLVEASVETSAEAQDTNVELKDELLDESRDELDGEIGELDELDKLDELGELSENQRKKKQLGKLLIINNTLTNEKYSLMQRLNVAKQALKDSEITIAMQKEMIEYLQANFQGVQCKLSNEKSRLNDAAQSHHISL